MHSPRYPSLYQINTRVWLTALAASLGRPATLDDIPDAELDRLRALGFDWIWFLSVWQTGAEGKRISRSHPEWRKEFAATLPDLQEEDIVGSGFAIAGYTVAKILGGDAALARLRERLRQRGLRLMLDFVPNHTGLDHPWVAKNPDYFIRGSAQDLVDAPQNFTTVKRRGGDLILAHGRDPYFAGWPDTLQLNYGNAKLQRAMIGELERIAGQCDGLRCDMAMLVLPDVFKRTWGLDAELFWPAAIAAVRKLSPGFLFMAEVYWEREWTMQQQGFDYAYDKKLYDRLRTGDARSVREHFYAGLDYQDKLARFLENHDEPRAAATFAPGQHEAAAVITFLSPGIRFFHQGQFEGCLKRISPHLGRGPDETANPAVRNFYAQLLAVLSRAALRQGQWQLLDSQPTYEHNPTAGAFVAFAWQTPAGERLIVAVNYSARPGQCFIRLPFSDLGGRMWRLQDLMADACYDRDGTDLQLRGLYLDVPAWHHHVFEFKAV